MVSHAREESDKTGEPLLAHNPQNQCSETTSNQKSQTLRSVRPGIKRTLKQNKNDKPDYETRMIQKTGKNPSLQHKIASPKSEAIIQRYQNEKKNLKTVISHDQKHRNQKCIYHLLDPRTKGFLGSLRH